VLPLCLAIQAVLFLGVLSLPADEPPKDRVFSGTARVDLVTIEVWVGDRRGNPVWGLDRDDFVLEIDGQQASISNFRAPTPPSANLAPGTIREFDIEELPLSPIPHHLAVFIDHTNLRPRGRHTVEGPLRELLRRRTLRGDRIMVATYGAGLTVHSGFADGPEALEPAFASVSVAAAASDSEERSILRELETSAANDPVDTLRRIETYARSERQRTRRMLGFLASYIDTVAGLPGRRSVVYVGDGFEVNPGQTMYSTFARVYSQVARTEGVFNGRTAAARESVKRDLEAMIAHANAARVTIHTLDAGSITDNHLSNVDASGSATLMVGREAIFDRMINFSEGLQRAAEDTGGLALAKVTDETIWKLDADLEWSYSIAFHPNHEPDGRERTIRIQVNEPAHEVRHRETYRLGAMDDAPVQATLTALRIGTSDNPLAVDVSFEEHAERRKRRFLVPVSLHVPTSGLVLVPQGDRAEGRVEIRFAVENKRGSSPLHEEGLPIVVPTADLEAGVGGYFVYDVTLELRPGNHQIGISVHDAVGDTTTATGWDVEITDDGRIRATPRVSALTGVGAD